MDFPSVHDTQPCLPKSNTSVNWFITRRVCSRYDFFIIYFILFSFPFSLTSFIFFFVYLFFLFLLLLHDCENEKCGPFGLQHINLIFHIFPWTNSRWYTLVAVAFFFWAKNRRGAALLRIYWITEKQVWQLISKRKQEKGTGIKRDHAKKAHSRGKKGKEK